MRECICCGNMVDNNETFCKICGLPLLFGKDVSDDIKNKLADENRRKYLENISINLITYQYEIDKNTVKDSENEEIELVKAIDLNRNNIIWLDKNFDGIDSDRNFILEIIIIHNEVRKKIDIKFIPKKKISHEKIGAILMPGFKFKIAVGERDDYILSDEMSLII